MSETLDAARVDAARGALEAAIWEFGDVQYFAGQDRPLEDGRQEATIAGIHAAITALIAAVEARHAPA